MGALGATTSATASVTLQLGDLHGEIAVTAIVTGLSPAVSYYVETRWDGGFSRGEAISNFVYAAFVGGVLGGACISTSPGW